LRAEAIVALAEGKQLSAEVKEGCRLGEEKVWAFQA
jgi:hypothetical protein